MGEEQDEDQEIQQIALGSNLSPIDVHRVADRFKCVERNADRHDDVQNRADACTPQRSSSATNESKKKLAYFK